MIHARDDYNRIQDPAVADPSLLSAGSTPIGADEPVMLFRAQDEFFINVLEFYAEIIVGIADDKMVDAIDEQIKRAHEWQASHKTKVPDLPAF